MENFIFKVADQDWEFEEIFKLNYQSFVEEIPQHEKNNAKKLIDKFHSENIYVVCLKGNSLIGMIAYRNKRPFSLDGKLENLDSYLPLGRSICEIRLLAMVKEYRYSDISLALVYKLINYSLDTGSDIAIFSGTVRQIKLYGHIGSVCFGPLVGSDDAQYQPMYLTDEAFEKVRNSSRFLSKISPELQGNGGLSFDFLPGPVKLSKLVKSALCSNPHSHRGTEFINDFNTVRQMLCELVNTQYVQIMMGPGTAANDAIAAQLSLLQEPGLILVNGEFSRRLVNYAKGAGVSYEIMEIAEGNTFSKKDILLFLKENPDIGWLWSVHCETSTGVLTNIDELNDICCQYGIKLCLDCISTIGVESLDLSNVYLASGTSGKGLVSVSGLAMVFYNYDMKSSPDSIPSYLDLGYYQDKEGIPFTIQSNLVYALLASLTEQDWKKRYNKIYDWAVKTKKRLKDAGIPVLVGGHCASSAVITVVIPEDQSSLFVGDELKKKDILVSYRTRYLLNHNWIQICMMGNDQQCTRKLVRLLKAVISI